MQVSMISESGGLPFGRGLTSDDAKLRQTTFAPIAIACRNAARNCERRKTATIRPISGTSASEG